MRRDGNAAGALLMSGSMAAFTLNDAVVRTLRHDLPLGEIIFLRGLMVGALLLLLARLFGRFRLSALRRAGRLIAVRAAAEAGATVCFLLALFHLPILDVTAVLQVLPLSVTLGAALVFGEPVGWRRIAAIGLGFVGVMLILRPGTPSFGPWSWLALAAVALVTVRDLVTRRLPPAVPSLGVAAVSALAVTAVGGLWVLAGGGWESPPGWALGRLALAAVLIFFGYLFAVMVMRVGEVAVTAAFRYTALVWAALAGWLIWGERPDAATLAGAALVVGSGLFALWRARRRAAAAPAPPERRARP